VGDIHLNKLIIAMFFFNLVLLFARPRLDFAKKWRPGLVRCFNAISARSADAFVPLTLHVCVWHVKDQIMFVVRHMRRVVPPNPRGVHIVNVTSDNGVVECAKLELGYVKGDLSDVLKVNLGVNSFRFVGLAAESKKEL
jgi:hypothetical protein